MLLSLSSDLTAQIRTSVNRTDARHLWYVSLYNVFDSAFVYWQSGEFQLNTGSVSRPIYLQLGLQEWLSNGASSRTEGMSQNGRDSMTGRLTRTMTFEHPDSGSVSFFRLWSAQLQGSIPLSQLQGHIQHSWADVRWTLGTSFITDSCSVVIEVIDEATGTALYTIDSVTMHSTPNNPIAIRGGTDPDVSIRVVNLKSGYGGRKVFLQGTPTRYGSSPRGFLFIKDPFQFALSALYANEHLLQYPSQPQPRWMDSAYSAMIDAAFYQDLLAATMQANALDSCPPALFNYFHQPDAFASAYESLLAQLPRERYRQACTEKLRADTLWWMSTLTPDPMAKPSPSHFDATQVPRLKLYTTSDSRLTIDMLSVVGKGADYRVYDAKGAQVGSGSIKELPTTRMLLETPPLASGIYFVVVTLPNQHSITGVGVVTK